MKRQKKLAMHFAVFIILLAVLWGLLVLSAMIPNKNVLYGAKISKIIH